MSQSENMLQVAFNQVKKDVRFLTSADTYAKMNQNQLIAMLTLALLVVGVGTGIFLGQQGQDVRQQAAYAKPCSNTTGPCGNSTDGASCTSLGVNGVCQRSTTGSGSCFCVSIIVPNTATPTTRPAKNTATPTTRPAKNTATPTTRPPNNVCGSASDSSCFPGVEGGVCRNSVPGKNTGQCKISSGTTCVCDTSTAPFCGSQSMITCIGKVKYSGCTTVFGNPGFCEFESPETCACVPGAGNLTPPPTVPPTAIPTNPPNPTSNPNPTNIPPGVCDTTTPTFRDVCGTDICAASGPCFRVLDQIGTNGSICASSCVPDNNCPGCIATPTPTTGVGGGPSPTPVALACFGITMTTPGGAVPAVGENVTFTCANVVGADRYEFQGVTPAGTPFVLPYVGNRLSANLLITTGGSYRVECRPCTGSVCAPWESEQL